MKIVAEVLIGFLPQWEESKFWSFHPISASMKLSSTNANLATVQVLVAKNFSLHVGIGAVMHMAQSICDNCE